MNDDFVKGEIVHSLDLVQGTSTNRILEVPNCQQSVSSQNVRLMVVPQEEPDMIE